VKRAAILLLFAAGAAWTQTGDWIANIDVGLTKLRLALHLAARADGSFTGALDSIDQDAFGLPLAGLRVRGHALEFEVPKMGGRFWGDAAEDGTAIAGQWRQRGGKMPIRFERGNIRPQEPSPPFPYQQENVLVRNGPIRLAGTLTLPRTAGPHPAVLLITGSGPQDRNETTSGHRPFLVWADFLTRRGFAVLRMDDRGVGGSSGKLLDSTDEEFADDALRAVAYLKTRQEIDPRRIGLVGHSEGGAVAPLAAARSSGKSGDIAFLVLLAGPAIPGREVLAAQDERISRAMGLPEQVARRNREIQTQLFTAAQNERDPAAARKRMEAELAWALINLSPEEAALIRAQVGGQMKMATSRWFRFVWNYDPRPALRKVACPVLALYGDLDLQVPADLNAPAMEQALAGNPKHRVVTIPGVNHLFQNAVTGSPVEYARIEETVAASVLDIVADWLK
jgi:uncharacterized protein